MIEINSLGGNDDDFELMNYILNNAKGLELFSVDVRLHGSSKENILWQENELCEKLFGFQKSSTCEIKFHGRYVRLSNKDFVPRRRSIRLAKDRLV